MPAIHILMQARDPVMGNWLRCWKLAIYIFFLGVLAIVMPLEMTVWHSFCQDTFYISLILPVATLAVWNESKTIAEQKTPLRDGCD
jgi:hypothetical protein